MQPLHPQTSKTTLKKIPPGRAGTRATLQEMEKMVVKGRANYTIIKTARDLVIGLPGKNWVAEAQAIHHFVRDHIRYVKDPVGMETIAEPQRTLDIGQGDCDDKCILAVSLLQSIGHPARFVAVGFNGGPLSHVLVQTQIKTEWIWMELCATLPLGVPPNGVTSYMTQSIALPR